MEIPLQLPQSNQLPFWLFAQVGRLTRPLKTIFNLSVFNCTPDVFTNAHITVTE
jgi:hypothetical protein